VAMLSGCGNTGRAGASTNATTATTQSPAVSSAGCGAYCQQAGGTAGPVGPLASNPYTACDVRRCHPCPPGGCTTLLSTNAAVIHGIVPVRLRCNVSSSCDGVLKLCNVAISGRVHDLARFAVCLFGTGPRYALAESEFVIHGGQTETIGVALTPLGGQVFQPSTSYLVGPALFLKRYSPGSRGAFFSVALHDSFGNYVLRVHG
jgi:hypothetical protein